MLLRTRSAVLGVLWILASAGPAHAQATVRSKLSLELTLSRTIPSGPQADESEIQRIRFTTKDFLALVGDSLGASNLRSLVLERSADPGDEALDLELLSQPIAVLDDTGARVELLDVLHQTPSSLDRIGPQMKHVTSAARRDAQRRMASRTDTKLEAATWDLRHPSDDPVDLTLVGVETARSRRRSLGAGVDGLLFTSRSADVNGGVSFPLFNPHSSTLVSSGSVAGTVRAAAEEVLD